jgi:PAS domain S-box-containing protein
MPRSVPPRPEAQRLFFGGGLALVAVIALCALAGASYFSESRWVEHALEVQQQIDEWTLSLLEAQTNMRGYIVTQRPSFLRSYEAAVARERSQLAGLKRLVLDNPAQLARTEAAGNTAEALISHLSEQVARVQTGQLNDATHVLGTGEGQRLMGRFRDIAGETRHHEEQLVAERRAKASTRAWVTVLAASLLALVSFGLLLFGWKRESKHERRVSHMAREARERLRVLAELAGALSSALTTEEVTRVVVEHGQRAAGGDICTLYVLDATGRQLELVGSSGVASEVLAKIRVISETHGNPGTMAAMKAGRSVWAENEADYLSIYPELALLKVSAQQNEKRAKAFWSVPLVAEGQAVGLLGVGFYRDRAFSSDERVFVDTLANQCAQAVLRASRRAGEEQARRWFDTTLRSIGDAVIATDDEGLLTFMNPIAESLTGWRETEAVGQPLDRVFRIISEQTRASVESPVTKVLREGKVVGLANHTLLLAKNGGEIAIDDSGAPIRNDAGEIVGVVLVFRDVTQEKRLESRNAFLAKAGEALVSSLDYQSTLATVARFAVPQLADWCAVELVDPLSGQTKQVAVAHVDPHKVQFARDLGERYPPDPHATTGVPAVIRGGKSELYPDIPPALIEASVKDAEHLRLVRELRLKSAMVVPLRSRGRTFGAMTFVYAESERVYTPDDLAFAEDVARRAAMAIENSLALKEADEARARERWLRDEAERANRAKDEFLATVSHELRTPLNAILGWTVTLKSREAPPEVERALTIIERNARSQAKLIEDMLDVSRIISGKLALNLGPTNVAAAVRAAIETVSPAAESKRIELLAEVADESLAITADADRLQQIVWNLLSNAVKFTPALGLVSLRVTCEGSDVSIAVTDSGEGIKPEVLPLIFEPFQQADSSTTRRHGGLGLGLSIVKQLVAAHGGSVRAKSNGPGQGSTFTVQLPARLVVRAIDAEAPGLNRTTDTSLASVHGARLDGLRVLIVDDERDALALVEEVLRGQGAEVHAASSVGEALERFASVRPDVIVSDIGMPDEDGYSFIRKVRAQPAERGGRTPAVALTAYARPQDAQRAFLAGFQMHLTKPIEPATLAGVVANLGGRSLGS